MKQFLTLILLYIITLTVKDQYPGVGQGGTGGSSVVGRISGTVIDSFTIKPIDYATVALFAGDAKAPISGVITDEIGNFKLDNIQAGTYKINVCFIGYPA